MKNCDSVNDYDLQKISCFYFVSYFTTALTPPHFTVWWYLVQMESQVKISDRKLQESSALFAGKNCVQSSLFWLLPLLIFCVIFLYFKGIRTERKKVYAAISLIPLCNIRWVQQLLTDWAPAQEEGETKWKIKSPSRKTNEQKLQNKAFYD